MSKGRTEVEFWTLTPRQLTQFSKAHEVKMREEHNSRMSLAWHAAWLGHHDPKKMPKLKTLFLDAAPKRKQSAEEMEQVLRHWAGVWADA